MSDFEYRTFHDRMRVALDACECPECEDRRDTLRALRARVAQLEAALQDIAECWPDTPAGGHAEAALAALDRAGSAEGGKP